MSFFDKLFNSNERVAWWVLVPLLFLVFIYAMLSYLAFYNQPFWYESMGIPQPGHGFLLLSWGGKNNAMLISLVLGILTRQRLPILIAMAVLFTGQLGDAFAGAQTGVNVFVTYIAMALVAFTLVLLYVEQETVFRQPVSDVRMME
ncbi:MAG: hypothetical protein AAF633_19110 [Chloroflexota bacterium]